MKSRLVILAGLLLACALTAGLLYSARADVKTRPIITEGISPDFDQMASDADFPVHLYTIDAKTKVAKDKFEDGDLMALKFKSNEAGYIWVFNFDMYGDVRLLFPNKHDTANKIRGSRWYYIGTRGADFKWRASADEKGVEYIFAVVGTNNDKFLDKLDELLQDLFPSVSSDGRDFLKNKVRPFITEEGDSRYGFGYHEVYLKP